jgi:hypothetical protein
MIGRKILPASAAEVAVCIAPHPYYNNQTMTYVFLFVFPVSDLIFSLFVSFAIVSENG